MTSRRERALAVGACLSGAAIVLVAVGRPWTRLTVDQGALLPAVRLAPSGRTLAASAGALALVGLAGVLALVATRGRWRLLVGLLLALAGAAISVGSVQVALDLASAVHRSGVAETATGTTEVLPSALSATAWPWVSAAGGTLLLAAGVMVMVRSRSWAVLSARYDAPTRDRPLAETSLWDALDRGDDPT